VEIGKGTNQPGCAVSGVAPLISDWQSVRPFVEVGRSRETRWFEFKVACNRKDKRSCAAKEYARDIAQFANTLGGVLLFGVEEHRSGPLKGCVKAVPGIRDVDATVEFLEKKVAPFLQPSSYRFDIVPVYRSGADPILAVVAPPCMQGLVAVWKRGDSNGVEYLHRTSYGKEYLFPDQVAERIGMSRRVFLMLSRLTALPSVASNGDRKRVKLASAVRLPGPERDEYLRRINTVAGASQMVDPTLVQKAYERRTGTCFDQFAWLCELNENRLRLRVDERDLWIPLSRVSDVWESELNSIGMIIDGTVVVPKDRNRPPFLAIGLQPGRAVV
jgi:hypothetical protein